MGSNSRTLNGLVDVRSEAEILHRCRHSNVVGVVGVCDTYPRLCLLMEWCPRGSLWDVLLKERESGGDSELVRGTTSFRSIYSCRRLIDLSLIAGAKHKQRQEQSEAG